VLVAVDVTETLRLARSVEAYRGAVDDVTARLPPVTVFDRAARLVEALCDDSRCAIFTVSGSVLELAAAPSVPASWARAAGRIVDSAPNDQEPGTLGPLPAPLAELCQQHGLRAGRGLVVRDVASGAVTGLVAWFPAARRFAAAHEHDTLADAALLCSLALDRTATHGRLDRAERVDALSGLLRRPAFVAEATELLGRHRRVGLVVAKVAGLAEINREHGFEAGDVVLRTVAERIARTVRAKDVAGRLAGATFAIAGVEPERMGREHAFVERLTAELTAPIPACGQKLRPEVLLGTAASRPDDTLAALIERGNDHVRGKWLSGTAAADR
jgi:diguanylate cyclase (GGDEF)-like protein